MLITFEGGEGAGKSTLVDALYEWLKGQGIPVMKTREPGGTELGNRIRELLLNGKNGLHIAPSAELLLMLAARAQHIEEVIQPALERGILVLCDRFNDSTIAYQGAGRGLGMDYVEEMCRMTCHQTLPSLTLYLDLSVDEGFARIKKLEKIDSAKGSGDRFESERETFHHKVRDAFLLLIEQEPERFHVIDASQSKEAVFKEALNIIESRYGTINRKSGS